MLLDDAEADIGDRLLLAVESLRHGWLFGYAGFDEAALRDAAKRVGPLFMIPPSR